MNKVLILGSQGYLGLALRNYLEEKGHKTFGVDNGLREKNVRSIGSKSLIPWVEKRQVSFIDILDYQKLKEYIKSCNPDTIVHFAEQPSAPFSMISQAHSIATQYNNIIGTLNVLWAIKEINPDIHLIKLGTMGVYGTPEQDIPETDEPAAYDPASFYHNSKAADSINIRKSCEWWGLKATDLHQGVVYGYIDDTRFDYDEYFGTVVNRFLVQSLIGYPLTIYGKGGQTRGFINIKDTLQCIEIAIKNPPIGYRVFHQFTEIFSVNQIAEKVSILTGNKSDPLKNPRHEKEEHYYNPVHRRLLELGLKPHHIDEELLLVWNKIQEYRDNVIPSVIAPKTTWK